MIKRGSIPRFFNWKDMRCFHECTFRVQVSPVTSFPGLAIRGRSFTSCKSGLFMGTMKTLSAEPLKLNRRVRNSFNDWFSGLYLDGKPQKRGISSL
ncbi:hypothetical protein JOE21_000239 [Desmospora profundinema]|uniref:Uncharacterized protein n=1 Tax=Desmospora profundinema TaxID=1571184 RepID=A0ABU1IHK0_9BACL|nr:hypothetical protein [Desmospora profundinema]